jgi:hypothetical protein
VLFWAVVSDEIHRVIELFPSRDEAGLMLARVLRDEPDWRATSFTSRGSTSSSGLRTRTDE